LINGISQDRKPMKRKLDAIDLKILDILQRDGRITNQLLSDQVGLSARPCLERVRRLEKLGLIKGYAAQLDLAKVQKSVKVVTEIQLGDYRRDRALVFERRLLATPEVISLYEVSGGFDYIAIIISESVDAYQALTAKWLDDPDLGVARIVSNVILRPLREFGPMPLSPIGQSDDP
jgi:DNA-binding Lrp family transcriptional regulator